MAAETDLRIKVSADTGAAQDAIGRLSDETLGLAKAADTSGDAIKRTAAATADATAKTNAAREATARAAKALSEHTAIVAAFGKDSREAAESQARLKAAQEAADKAAREAERSLKAAAEAVEETAKNADDKAVPALRRMKTQLEAAGKSADAMASDLRALEARAEQVSVKARSMGAAFSSFVGNLAADAVSSLAGKLGDLGMHALTTAASFESMKTALASTLGSQEEANKKFAELQQFASATPFALEETTQGFLKLKNLGLDASTRAMTAYGDMAGATGKTMMDVVEAVADAAQGEGERLKELGIRMSKDGDKVRLTFRGMTEELKFDSKEIEQYLIRLGETNFSGGMLAQSKTLGGLWSSMKDGADQLIVSIMDSGITQALKDMMGTFSGMGETGKLLGDILGFGLGAAFTGLAGTVKVAAAAIEGFATVANFLLSPVHMAKDAVKSLADDAFAVIAVEAEKAAKAQEEADRQYWESAKGSGNLASEMQRLIDLSGQYATAIIGEGLAHLEAANAADRRLKSEADLWKKLEERNAKAEEKAIEEQFFAANEMGPALPPGFGEKKKKGKGKKKDGVSMSDSLDAASRYEKRERAEREGAFAAEVAAYEQEAAARSARIASIDQEIAALEARGIAETESVDLIFYTLETESEAARAREALIDDRIAAEERLARWQVKNAVTEEQREKARTRLDAAEHAKRLRSLEKVTAAEAKEHAKREKAVGAVVGAVTQLGEGMVDAFERMAEGEKGAIASMISELLKGVAKKHAILALGEAALAVGAVASYRYGAAAKHLAAAGLHTGVAIAAGVGAYAAGQVADARQGGGDAAESAGRGSGAGGSGGRSTGGSRRDDGDLEAQEVPVSHEQLRRGDPRVARGGGGAQVVISGTVNIYGAGGKAEFINDIRQAFDRQDRRGARPRN